MKSLVKSTSLCFFILSSILYSCKKEEVPVVTTIAVTNITVTTATSGGNITNEGSSTVIARGVCWSTGTTPTIDDTKTTDGAGAGSFSSNIAGLTGNTIYFIRAYATSSAGTGYGMTLSFTTNPLITTLSTITPTSITCRTATCGGIITNDGGAPVLARGVCWSTSSNPTIAYSLTSDGTGIGTFTSSITGLKAGTTYYVRAYATNSAGTGYGNEINFTTNPATVPALTTTKATSIAQSTATSGGNISSDGGTSVYTRGVCWSTSVNPTIANSLTSDGTGIGTFTSSITGLTLNTTYYVRAYATNNVGVAYGNEVSFTTSATLTIGDSYQGGKVAYILQSGDPGYIAGQIHGIIAAPSDQNTTLKWYNGNYSITGAPASALGTGNTNTNNIVTIQGAGSYAAKSCYDLALGGYVDWYLPSKDELQKIYDNRSVLGVFVSNDYYWSSTEVNSIAAWGQYFLDGEQLMLNKSVPFYVRAVRAF